MTPQTPQGRACAAQLSAALVALAELSKVSEADAEALWRAIAAHLRSSRPQVLMQLEVTL